MTKILIAGPTGLVGGYVLQQALADTRVTRVVAPTRQPLPPHPKLFNPISDFASMPDDDRWWAVDGVVCTIGTTRAKAGSDEAFRAVDLDLQLAVARHARAHGATRFALTSS
ncbi:MAG TPA: NAD-dependent dehydratase, partial [Tianweitania sediminis]|nr:NAD-dependent dehydratase [Tianweitania sediminis]